MSGKLTKADYPPNWRQLREQVLARAQDGCECIGECGDPHCWRDDLPPGRCAAPNHALIVRDPAHPAVWYHAEDGPHPLMETAGAIITVTLTIAHLCQDSRCDDLTHLRALCNRCHLVYDGPQHIRNAQRTKKQQMELAGQLSFLPQEPS